MSSTLEEKDQDHQHCACTSHSENVSDDLHMEPPSSSQIEEEDHALATKTANLDLEDQDNDPDLSSKNAEDTWSDEEAPSETIDESSEPQPGHAIATAPTDSVQTNQSKPTHDVKDAVDDTASKDTNPESLEDDETNTPRFQTYVKLHNDMMIAKTALVSDTTELTNLYTHASRLARVLLTSNEKHGDLPLVMHAQACLVLGCSDEDDCYERMEDALVLLKHAMNEGALGQQEGQSLIKTCEVVMGLRGQTLALSDDEEGGEDEGEEDSKGEGDEHEECKDEGADDGEGLGKNDALP